MPSSSPQVLSPLSRTSQISYTPEHAFIPEQFTVKAHPALFEGEGMGRGKKSEEKSEGHFYSSLHSHSHSNLNFKVEYLKNGTR